MSTSMIMKGVLVVFVLIGIPIAIYGGWQVLGTMKFVGGSTGRSTAVFAGYYREKRLTRNTTSSKSLDRSYSLYSTASYPEFTYRTEDGGERKVRERKVHIVEVYKEGDAVEILLSPYGDPRIAGFYSLYGRDLAILVLGLGFALFPLLFWKLAAATVGGAEQVDRVFGGAMQRFLDRIDTVKVGPVPFRYILVGFGGFMLSILLFGAIMSLAPFVKQARIGSGGRLIAAIEEQRFDDARTMVADGSGINATNEFGQTPLLLALEAGRTELARVLVEAGADVNVKSKMLMTPLRVATQSGDMEMVRLLLSRGASPDAPENEFPPVAYALAEKHYEIARALIEGGTDLRRRYAVGNGTGTVGDMAALARRQDLVELVRKRGGELTR